jgi:type I restriction enzyme S subunit
MNQSLTSYPTYKPAGLPWLDKVPTHWELLPLATILKERNQDNEDGKMQQVLSVMKDKGVILYEDKGNVGNKKSEDITRYKIVQPGDLVLNSMNVIIGSVGVSRYEGCLSPVYYVLTPRKAGASIAYLAWLFADRIFQQSLVRIGNGILAHRMRIPMELLKRESLPIPPLLEQQRIVAFLDAKGRQIAGLLRHKRQLIKLLNEQRQALIHKSVTQGLKPDAPRKNSGISWLGEVPAHWEVKRTKYFYQEIDSRSTTGLETHLSMSQKFGLVPNSTLDTKRLISESYIGGKLCQKNDLVLNRLKAHLGVFALAKEPGLVSPDYTVLRATKHLCHKYFELILKTPACRIEFRVRTKGIVEGFWRLYTDDFYDIKLPFPPVDEQQEIVQHIEEDSRLIDQTISRAQREIELIQEYRTRLVADVVTGRVDVRHLANAVTEILLPDEIELEDEEDESEEELAEAEATGE